MSGPSYPFQEVYVRPPYAGGGDEPIVTLSRDSRGLWWHTVGDQAVRDATRIETLLPLAPATWIALGLPAQAIYGEMG